MTTSNLGVKGIDHVTLVVADLQRSRQFYVDLLGMVQVERPAFGFPGLWFQAGQTQVHLILESDEAGPAGITYRAREISRALHFALQVDDAHVTARQLRERGVPILSGPRNRPDGPVQLYIQDPDGHTVELFSHVRGPGR
jgi:catechol 2,3-dioxygenase-like lactoylglutathione lyase family enzyme